jgi:hypothetical protein
VWEIIIYGTVTLSGLVVACLPLVPIFMGSNLAVNDEVSKGDTNPLHDFLRGESKAVGPMS